MQPQTLIQARDYVWREIRGGTVPTSRPTDKSAELWDLIDGKLQMVLDLCYNSGHYPWKAALNRQFSIVAGTAYGLLPADFDALYLPKIVTADGSRTLYVTADADEFQAMKRAAGEVGATPNFVHVAFDANREHTWIAQFNTVPAVAETFLIDYMRLAPELGDIATISGATAASPCVLTTSTVHGLEDSDRVYISGVTGMTELNSQTCYVDVLTTKTLGLYTDVALDTEVDATLYTAHSGATGAISRIWPLMPGTMMAIWLNGAAGWTEFSLSKSRENANKWLALCPPYIREFKQPAQGPVTRRRVPAENTRDFRRAASGPGSRTTFIRRSG